MNNEDTMLIWTQIDDCKAKYLKADSLAEKIEWINQIQNYLETLRRGHENTIND